MRAVIVLLFVGCGGAESPPPSDSGDDLDSGGHDSGSTDSGSTDGSTDTGESSDSGGTDTGTSCVANGDSCAGGATCCDGLMCCSGLPLPDGVFTCLTTCPRSDRDAKEAFESVDPAAVLEDVASVAISIDGDHVVTDSFNGELGVSDPSRPVFALDATGAALVSIQALHAESRRIEAELAERRARLDALDARLEALER
jgi:hypothetical protein